MPIFKKAILLILIISTSTAYAEIDPKTLIFLTPKIPESKFENILDEGSEFIKQLDIKSTTTDDKKEYSIKVPVKNDAGVYEFLEVGFKEQGGKRSITIPGKGEIAVVKDEAGKYNIELTPEQIKGASNISCKFGSSGKGTCTISPYIKIIGNKTLSADKLVVDYTKGENLVIANGVATNLKLTDKDSVTNFNKSETTAGDTQIAVDFGKKAGGTKDEPKKISLSTAKMVHTVYNPKKPSESATKFQVKDGGVGANIVFNGDNNTAIEMNAATKGGVKYNSNPFSEKKVLIDTSSPVMASFKISNDVAKPAATLSLVIDGKDRDGKVSQTSIIDTNNPNKKSSITSVGKTYINLSQEATYDSKNYKVTTSDSPVAFEVGSEQLLVKNESKNGKVTETEIKGLQASGVVDSGKKDSKIDITAQEIAIKNTKSAEEIAAGKTSYTFSAQDLKGAMVENDVVKKQQAMVSHAYYNNGESELNLYGNSDISVSKFKNAATADKFNDKAIQKESYVIGSTATIKQKDSNVVLDGGVAIRQIDFFDKSDITLVNGSQGSVSGKGYNLILKDGFNFIAENDSAGKNRFTQVGATQLSAKKDDSSLEILNSVSSQQVLGQTPNGKDTLLIKHTSDGVDYVKGDGSKILNAKALKAEIIDADLVKFGNASFDKLTYQDNDSKSKVDILGAQVAIYTNETDPTKKIREGSINASQLNAKGVDYSLDVKAFDEKGVPGNFKIYFFEEGKTKRYKIFAENGKLVEIKGVDKNNTYAQVLLETIDYLETDNFKSILAKNVSGNLKTIDSGDEKLQSFAIGKLDGIQSIDGKFKQFSLVNGSFSEIVPDKSATEVDIQSANYFQKEEDGLMKTEADLTQGKGSYSKGVVGGNGSVGSVKLVQVKDKDGAVTQISIKGFNGQGGDEKSNIVLKGFNADAFDSKLIKYGNISFDQLKYQDKDPITKREALITGARVAVYTDESDPTNKIRQGQFSASTLNAKGIDYNVDVKAVDDKGVAGDFKIIIFEDGKTKQAKVFTEDGKLLEINGVDKNNRHAKVLLETIEYLEADGFKNILAKNLSGTFKTIDENNDNLQEFKIARLDGVQSLDGNYKKLYLENVNFSQTKDNINADFKTASIVQVKDGNDTASQVNINGLNAQGSNSKGKAAISGLSIDAFNSKLIKYGTASFDQLKYQDKDPLTKREAVITGAKVAVYTNESDPTNKIRQGELGLTQLNAKGLDYSVDVRAVDDKGVAGEYKIVVYEDGKTKSAKVFSDGKLIEINGIDKNNRHAKVLLETIEYLEADGFKTILAKNLSGSLKTIDANNENLQDFKVARLEGMESLDGSLKQYKLENVVFSQSQNNTKADFKAANILQSKNENGTTSQLDLQGLNAQSSNDNKNVSVSGANVDAFSSKLIKYGNISFDQLKYQDKDPSTKREVEITNAAVAVYTNDTDPTSKIKQGELGLTKLNAKAIDYSVDLRVLSDDGDVSKFKVVFFEDGKTKNYKIFGENGKLVQIDKLDADNSQTQILLETVEYLETDKFKQTMATNLSGSLKTVKPDNSKLQIFKFGKIEGLQSLDGSVDEFSIADGFVSQNEAGKSDASFAFKKMNFTQTNHLDVKDLKGEIGNGTIKYVEYKSPAKSAGEKINANLSFGSVLVNQVTDASKEKITAISAKNFEMVVVDYEALQKVNAKIGAIDVFETSGIKTIQMSDLKNLTVEDLEKGTVINFKSDKLIRVVNKDKDGNETGSYLLMNSAFLNATDVKSGVTADIRIGVLEVLQDKLNKQNVILEADIDGKIKLTKGKSPVGAEVNFALKGKNLVSDKGSYISDDKKTVSNFFAIKALDAGRLDNLKLSAGPDFLKEAISIQAKGSKEGGKSLKFSFEQDIAKGTYFIRTEFIEGDKVKVKLFPFTLESKKEGKDAVAELLITPKGQNYLNHLEIISNVVSAKEINEWLGVSEGGMIVAKTGTVGGFGFEMMYQNQDYFNPQGANGTSDKAASYGAGIYHKNKKGDKTSAGVLLSGDSEFQYNTNGRGVLKIFGVDMDKDGSIPATINLYVKKEYADGDSIYGGVFVDAASYAVDRNQLNSDAAFFEGGRNHSTGPGVTVAYSKVLNPAKNSTLTIAAGANDNFSNLGVCITYKTSLGAVSSLARNTMDVVNEIEEPKINYTGLVAASGPSMKGAIALLQDQINELDAKSNDVKALERIKNSLLNVINAIENKSLDYDKIHSLFNISESDLKILKKLEDKKMVSREVASEVRSVSSILKNSIIQKSELAQLYLKEAAIREAMEKITQDFKENSSAEIHQLYLEKVAELAKLKAQ